MRTAAEETQERERLKALFEPRSVAVIGASRRTETVGYAVLHNLHSCFKGKIYPVNPKADHLENLPCYASIDEIPDPVDLAVLIIPSQAIAGVLEACGKKGVKAAIIISAGFREVGKEGEQREREVVAIAHRYGMAVLGPNCLGLINTDPDFCFNASFSRTMPRPGNIAFISQSGALCAAILDYAKGINTGFSKFVSLGNKADVNELNLLGYLGEDRKTDVILMYVEDLVNGKAFIEAARDITGDQGKTKPILVIKSGRTPQGAMAASSHTGSLMGSDEVYDAIFAQGGVLRVDSVEEMFNLAVAFANEAIPKSNRVAIVTNAGGPGIMATDSCIRQGLELAQLDPATTQALKKGLPPTANLSNPVDVIGDAQHDRYACALDAIIKDPNVDSIIVILTPQAMTDIEEIARVIVDYDKQTEKTLLTCFMGFVDISAGVKILEDNGVPHYSFPEAPARALGAMCLYRNWIARPRTRVVSFTVDSEKARKVLSEASRAGQSLLTTYQAMEVFKAYGFPVLPYAIADDEKAAATAARKIGFPVVLKVVSREIVHKIDVGGVVLNLKTEDEVLKAAKEMADKISRRAGKNALEGFFVQGMAQKGREVILGMHRDPRFGPILMFGLGGIYVEALKDVTFRLAPIRELGAERMMKHIRAYPILRGIRGEQPADMEKIAECLERLSQLSCEQDLIKDIDINPLITYEQGQGAFVLDARIVLNINEERRENDE